MPALLFQVISRMDRQMGWRAKDSHHFLTKLSIASAAKLGRLGFPPLCRLSSFSLRSLPPPTMFGSTLRLSPFPSLGPAWGALPSRWSFLNSRYIFAASERGKGDGSAGISAPFWSRTSATGKGFLAGEAGRGGVAVPGESLFKLEREEERECENPPARPEGDTGSAAVRAR